MWCTVLHFELPSLPLGLFRLFHQFVLPCLGLSESSYVLFLENSTKMFPHFALWFADVCPVWLWWILVCVFRSLIYIIHVWGNVFLVSNCCSRVFAVFYVCPTRHLSESILFFSCYSPFLNIPESFGLIISRKKNYLPSAFFVWTHCGVNVLSTGGKYLCTENILTNH